MWSFEGSVLAVRTFERGMLPGAYSPKQAQDTRLL